MKLRHRLQHIIRKPPRVIAWKVYHRALRQARRYGYWSALGQRLAAQVDAIQDLRAVLVTAPQLIRVSDIPAATEYIRKVHASEADAIVASADECLALRFSYLGWMRQFDSLPLPWTSDWGTGRVWGNRYYADYDYSEPGRPSDVKSCWEPSRFHFAIALGQAYKLTGRPQYREHFFALLRDWHAQNPYAGSINWTSPLEVGIRGLNLAAAASLFADAPDDDLRFLVRMLAQHGAFIYRNVEYTDVRGNHYTGNLIGLLALGLLLENVVSEAHLWTRYAEANIGPEALLQYWPDGVNREKSIPYHRFVSEMFLLAATLLQRAGRPLAADVQDRLQSALQFTRAYTRPDGTAPIVGDNDNARALPLGTTPFADHSHLTAVGNRLWPRQSRGAVSSAADIEALWLFGPSTTDPSNGRHQRPQGILSYPEGGYHVFQDRENYLLVDAGDVGLQSGGCHGHHDMLSFELVLNGIPLIIDPGCPYYTGNIEKKNQFRSTAHHNTAVVDGTEQGLLNPHLIWHLGPEASPLDVRVKETPDGFRFSGGHAGYQRLIEPVTHHRTLLLGRDATFAGTDEFLGRGNHLVDIYFHFAPHVTVQQCENGIVLQSGGLNWLLEWNDAATICIIENGEVSPGYGEIESASVVRLSRDGPLPWALEYKITRK